MSILRKDYRSKITIEGRTVCGYAAVFNNIDYAGDLIKKGAFTRSIADNGPDGTNRIVFLLQHDKNQILGKPTVLKEDNTGLYFEAPIVPTTYGNDALELLKAGVLDGVSIGYTPLKQVATAKYNEVRDVKLLEFSAVTFPCNDLARVTDLKEGLFSAIEDEEPDEIADFVKQIYSKFPGYLSEDEQFAIELKELCDQKFVSHDLAGDLMNLFTQLSNK